MMKKAKLGQRRKGRLGQNEEKDNEGGIRLKKKRRKKGGSRQRRRG
jgi:hypothetical protein